MYQGIATICQVISSLSLLANFYLLYLYLRCPVRNLNAYKHFFLATALQDLLFSTCFILLAPITLSRDFAFAFLAYGPLRERAEGQGLMILLCMAFANSMVLVTDGFIYRYVQVCKGQLFNVLLCRRNVTLGLICNALIIVFWMSVIWMVYWPTPSLDEELGAVILDNTGLHAPELALIGVSLKTFTVLTFTLFIALVLLMSALGAIISWAAFKIHTTLKRAIYSSRLKELHRQMFVLLLLQSACPLCFLHAPCFLIYILFFGGVTSTPFLSSICSVLMASFPLFSPIIIIAFLKEYRRFALVSLRIYRPTSEVATISVIPSQRGQATIDWPQSLSKMGKE